MIQTQNRCGEIHLILIHFLNYSVNSFISGYVTCFQFFGLGFIFVIESGFVTDLDVGFG